MIFRHFARAIAIALALGCSSAALAGPVASLAELAWLEGSWEAEGIEGAPAVEVYSAAAGGAIPGHFRQMAADGTVMFYELITIVEQGGSLAYRLKHFNADLTGWEEQAEVREFALTEKGANRWTFGGLTYERTGADTMVASVDTTDAEGGTERLEFRFRRTHR